MSFSTKTKLCVLSLLCAKMPNELGSIWTYFICLAVMAALRNLQDRIRQLELERAQAEENMKDLSMRTSTYKYVHVFKTIECPDIRS